MARSRVGSGFVAVLVVLAATAGVWAGGSTASIDPLLRGVNFVPDRSDLDSAAGGSAVSRLAGLADGSIPTDKGTQIRAVVALRQYPGDPVSEAALIAVIATNGIGDKGRFVPLTAAMSSLPAVLSVGAVPHLVPLLSHAVMDVRFTAAISLARTGSPSALISLRDRLQIETSSQVRYAIMEAIRALAGP